GEPGAHLRLQRLHVHSSRRNRARLRRRLDLRNRRARQRGHAPSLGTLQLRADRGAKPARALRTELPARLLQLTAVRAPKEPLAEKTLVPARPRRFKVLSADPKADDSRALRDEQRQSPR